MLHATHKRFQDAATTYSAIVDDARAERRELVQVVLTKPRKKWASKPAGTLPVAAAEDSSTLIATVTLCDPERLNALSPAMMYQINQRLNELILNPRVRAIVITGSGELWTLFEVALEAFT